MTCDFTRNTFRPARRYTSVRMQQGRVLLDADWNEQADIARWVERLTNVDVIGPCGFPEDAAGFGLTTIVGDVLIGPGRGYVDGRLVENPDPVVVTLEPVSGSGANTVYRIAAGARLQKGQPLLPEGEGSLVTVTELGTDADGAQEVKLSAALGDGETVRLAAASVLAQPHLAAERPTAPAVYYLAYLEVWERPIGALEDPMLREEALGGPDTCQREQMIWQVKLLPLTDLVAGSASPADPPHCTDIPADWHPESGPAGLLAARAEVGKAEDDPCALPAAGGYRSLENHLYRVEIHNGGSLGTDTLTWKWSRDNAIHRARLEEIANGALVADSVGLDDATAYRTADWIEVLDEARILAGHSGFFVQIGEVNGNRLGVAKILDPETLAELTDTGAPDVAQLPPSGTLRRWEGGPPVAVTPGAWMALENGVEVQLSAGLLRTGDFWTIPARTVTADVVWPKDPASGEPVAVPPEGIARHFCKLAIVQINDSGGWNVVDDCRAIFPPLTGLLSLHYLGGDAQEAVPDPEASAALLPLAHPLAVGVARGSEPIEGEEIRFRIVAGTGRFADGSQELIVVTDAEGRGKATWSLDSTTLDQQVEAELIGAGGTPDHMKITFAARLSRASEVSFDPANCPPLSGDRTVQKAIEKLCQTQTTGCATYVLSPDTDWKAVLKGLKPGEDARVCFRRGEFRSEERIELKGLGHILLSGVGEGTRIIAVKRECALHFSDCESLHVSSLALLATDASDTGAPIKDLNGVLTTTRVAHVEVTDCYIETGASARRDRACLRIRQTDSGQARGQTRRALVRDNRFAVGDGQNGVMIDDAAIAIVESNEVFAIGVSLGTGEGGFSYEIERALVERMVRAPLIDLPAPGAAAERRVSAGPFSAVFPSFASQDDWTRAVKRTPPKEDDLRDAEHFEGYVRSLAKELSVQISENTMLMPSLGRSIDAVRVANPGVALPSEAVGRLLIADARVDVKPITETETEKAVNLAIREHRISFDSVFTEREWKILLESVGTAAVKSDAMLRDVVHETAERLVKDGAFRDRFRFAKGFIDGVKRGRAAVGQGIVCAGSHLDEVRVADNSLTGVHEGIRIAVSHAAPKGAPPDIVGSLKVTDNRIELRVPLNRTRGDQAIQIGNADRVAITRNEIVNTRTVPDEIYSAGIDLAGFYGPFVVLSENIATNTMFAIRMTVSGKVPAIDDVLWRAVGNLAINTAVPGFLFPKAVRQVDNLHITA